MDAATWLLAGAGLLTFGAIAYQAFLTRKLAESTKQDVAAQWRPLLVPCRLQGTQISVARGGMGFDTIEVGWANLADEGEFHCGFENVGKGPALALAGCELALPISDGKRSPYYFNPLATPVLPIDGKAFFVRTDASVDDNRVRVRIDYTDLAGSAHHTHAVYRRETKGDGTAWFVEKVVADGEIDK
jgi:hypothetical protein